jgi:hypothetical protein
MCDWCVCVCVCVLQTCWLSLLMIPKLYAASFAIFSFPNDRSSFFGKLPASFVLSLPSFYWLQQHLAPCNSWIFPSLKMGIQKSSFCVHGGNSTQRDSHTRIGLSEVRPATAVTQQRWIKCVLLLLLLFVGWDWVPRYLLKSLGI